MKFSLRLLTLFLTVTSAWAQALVPSGPALPPSSSPVMRPSTPLPPPNAVMPPIAPPPRPGTTPVSVNPGPVLAAQADLRGLLLDMQAVLQQTIPPLAAFNESFPFVVATNASDFTDTNTSPLALQPPLPAPSGQNLSSALGANNSSLSTGPNLSGNLSSVVGASPAMTMPSVPAGSSAAPFPPNPAVAAQTTNNVVVFTTRDTLRSLLVLQADLDRALALVDALNATPNPNIPGVNLTPTGR